MKDKKPLEWIPIYIDKHIFGSTRLELEPDERSVWTDLLVLSGKDNGFIRANEGVPYPNAQLAGMLVIPEELLVRTMIKCINYKKIEKKKDGTMYVINWDTYKLSPRHKRRFDGMSAKEDTKTKKGVTIEKEKEIEKGIDKDKEEKKVKKEKKITFNRQIKGFVNIKEEEKEAWKETYRHVDIDNELKKMKNWLLANPTRRYKNYHAFIVRWLAREEEKLRKQEAFKEKDPDWMREAKESKEKA